ncbi:hypothetical protein B0T18DRAFT_389742 [Schizothecium vesticola]|uniref:Tc1-like transposase DDE domain-containing protein n=1 Tax=Schizothecium vesticola TaxID=314040 RepID=A0AA40K8T1_9PEZI|nr:hypothetical protein B0T18DRAFT_389742 [Schizothecium vesticola]
MEVHQRDWQTLAGEGNRDRLVSILKEDNTPAHMHRGNATLMNLMDVLRLLWCPNSPDLNMIEPTWFYLKRQTAKKGAPQSRKQANKAWRKAWREMPQERIQ